MPRLRLPGAHLKSQLGEFTASIAFDDLRFAPGSQPRAHSSTTDAGRISTTPLKTAAP
jgi:hypothetical protein